jgi:hypothetical protein
MMSARHAECRREARAPLPSDERTLHFVQLRFLGLFPTMLWY